MFYLSHVTTETLQDTPANQKCAATIRTVKTYPYPAEEIDIEIQYGRHEIGNFYGFYIQSCIVTLNNDSSSFPK